jgi:lipopolysaccharide export LptBFGC system permease protein LptF
VGRVIAVALAFTVVVWVVLEWMMPQANQGFREILAARLSNGRVLTLQPGLSELGLSRLGQRSDPAAVRQYQTLWAICFASVPLSLLAFGLSRFVRRGASAVILATALSYSYLALIWTCAAGTFGSAVPAAVPAWTPNVVCVVIGCALLVRAQRPSGI